MKPMTPKELKAMQEAGVAFTLLDVRDPGAYQEKHIPGAVNLPPNEDFAADAASVAPDRDSRLVVYSGHEQQTDSGETCGKLEGIGYTNVSCLSVGLMGWMEQGYPVEFGRES
jgi:rhodanese-related sulfurtransferase